MSIRSSCGPAAEERGAGRQDVAVHDVQVERGGEGLRDGSGVGDRGERTRGGWLGSSGDLDGQAGLADTAGADHGHQTLVGEQSVDRASSESRPRSRSGGAGRRDGTACPPAIVRLELAEGG